MTLGSLFGSFGEFIASAGFAFISLFAETYLKKPLIEAIFLVMDEAEILFEARNIVYSLKLFRLISSKFSIFWK